MNPIDFTKLTIAELLSTHSEVLDELRHRNVIRSNKTTRLVIMQNGSFQQSSDLHSKQTLPKDLML
jgi:hypothetical protein